VTAAADLALIASFGANLTKRQRAVLRAMAIGGCILRGVAVDCRLIQTGR